MDHQRIKLYQGTESECSYLPDKLAVNIYADPHHPRPDAVYNQLIARGFRRSGEYVYRPGCTNCTACVPVRILADHFVKRRVDRRNIKRNSDLQVEFVQARLTAEYFDLYQRYLAQRHPEGGMDNPAPEDFERFLLNPWGETIFVEIRDGERCIAVAVTDATPGGLSAVYTFFDPDELDRSLGRFCILQQLALCQRMGIPYLYLGYWVEGSRKMRYKIDYRPQEHYDGRKWNRIDRKDTESGSGFNRNT